MDFGQNATYSSGMLEGGEWKVTFPEPKMVEEELVQEISEEEKVKVWNDAAETVKTYHDELVQGWQVAMDSLLVYAGLFSAVLTAFNVQSYQLLQPASTDPMLAALQQISAQLNSFSFSSPFINSTQPAQSSDQTEPPFRAPTSAVWINTLWFASLVCSLASASIALIVKQWLYEVSSGLSGSSRETARVRQYRLNGLMKWQVGAIVLIPSVLLQVALVLFLVGLLTLLWTLHDTVAGVTTALAGALFCFLFAITILPVFRWDCSYRSPQALGTFLLVRTFWNGSIAFAFKAIETLHISVRYSQSVERSTLLRWISRTLSSLLGWVTNMPRMPTWYGAEQGEVVRDAGVLDRCIATTAYTITFATRHLENMHVALAEIPAEQVPLCFADVYEAWSRLWGGRLEVAARSEKLKQILFARPLLYGLRRLLTVDEAARKRLGGHWSKLGECFLCGPEGKGGYLPRTDTCVSTLALLASGNSSHLAWRAAMLLSSIGQSPELDLRLSYRTLKHVLVMCQQRARRSAVVDDESEVLCLLGIARLILRCIPQARMDGTSQPLVSEQEERVFKETRDCLADLVHLFTVIPERNWSPVYLSDLRKSLKFDLIQPLTVLCQHLPGGPELIPEGLVETVDQFRFWTLDRYGWGLEWETNGYLGALQLALKKRKYDKARGIPQACLSFQQHPIIF
ncbi:hypothetical protein V8D89_007774 [Ganoderma adspersum]